MNYQNDLTSKKSDLPTMVLHWGMVLALLVSVSSGWRIASMTDSGAWMRWVDVLVLQGNVEHWHFVSASLLTGLVIAYLGFLLTQGLGGRLSFRRGSLSSRDRQVRWTAINKLIYWGALALLALAALTGVMLYFFPGALPTEPLALVHKVMSWGFVVYIGLHVVAQLIMGGMRQLLKIVSPRMAYGMGAVTALSLGVAGTALAYLADRSAQDTLSVVRTDVAPVLDGNAEEKVWADAPEAVVHTSRGFNLAGGNGEVEVHVKAVRDDDRAYFLFRWQDATRSQKHIPLQKTVEGWKLMHSQYFINDENDYYEDKFAVMLAPSPIAGGNTMNIGPKPFKDKPGPTNGLGLHATTDGSLADVWHWKSVRSGTLNQFDDNYFGAPMEPKPSGRYTAGYTQDPKAAGGFESLFEKVPDSDYVKLKALPRDVNLVLERMGPFDPNPAVSDMGELYAIPKEELVPYTEELDALIPVGTVIPSVVSDKPFEGDRGDVRAHAQWKDGWWTIEASRALDTGSPFDQAIASDVFMWVAVFDHNQVRHTRHVHPLRLAVAP